MTSHASPAPAPALHGVYLGEEANGITYVYCYADGSFVHQEPVPTAELDMRCEALERWLEQTYRRRPALFLMD